MIERVTSKVLPGIVTHVIVKIAEPTSGKSKRQDFCDPANPLQVAEIPLPKGYKMAPHRHDVKKLAIHDAKAQECWIVKKGSIRVILYDLDDTKIKSEILKCGDFLVTLGGGHGMETLEDEATILEVKNGPFTGRDYTSFVEKEILS